MPRMEAFECPKFPLESAAEINIRETESLIETTNTKLTVLDDGVDSLNTVLKQTKIGHEAHLWGQEVDVDPGDVDEP